MMSFKHNCVCFAIVILVLGYNPVSECAITPEFLTNSSTFRVALGDPVDLPCEIQYVGSLVILWRRENSILSVGRHRVTRDPRFSIHGEGRHHDLHLSSARLDDQGEYSCQIGDGGAGKIVHHLEILSPPEVNVLVSWINSGDGLEAKLDCIVHADPPAEVLWYQDSFALQPTDRRIMSTSGKNHSLTIKNIQLSDFGNYSCVVVNSIGKDEQYIELSGKPGPAMVISSGYSGPHEHTFNWTVQSVFPITEVLIMYRRLLVNDSYQHAGKWHHIVIQPTQSHFTPSTNERSYHYRLTDLTADSVYESMVQCRNKNGWGELSDMHQWFTKHRGAPDHAVYADSAGGLSPTAVGVMCVALIVVLCCAFCCVLLVYMRANSEAMSYRFV